MTRRCCAYGCLAAADSEPVPGVVLCRSHLDATAAVLAPPAPPSTAVVYYAWVPHGRPRIGATVKIGYSSNVHSRMASLGCDLLATEPGDRTLEHARHRQYAHLRVEREYFRPGDDLMTHVETLTGHRLERL